MIDKEKLRNHWLFKKQEIKDGDSFFTKYLKYSNNHKSSIMIECGILSLVLWWLRNNGYI